MRIANEQTIDYLITKIKDLNEQILARCLQLTGDQTVSGTKTFRAPIRGMLGGSEETTILSKIERQGIKNIRNLAVQDQNGYLNYTHWEWVHQMGDSGPQTTAFWVGLRGNNVKTYWGCAGNLLQFLTPSKIRNISEPTDNTDAANKAYVDALKTQIKTMAANAADFAAFKAALANW